MRCLIIGLGNFGTALAHELTALANEVIAVDPNERNVESVKDQVEAAYIMDTTDDHALGALPLKEVDVTVVTIGENLAASLRTVVNLQKRGVKNIYARAYDDIHRSILEAIGNVTIVTPEADVAKSYAQKLSGRACLTSPQ